MSLWAGHVVGAQATKDNIHGTEVAAASVGCHSLSRVRQECV